MLNRAPRRRWWMLACFCLTLLAVIGQHPAAPDAMRLGRQATRDLDWSRALTWFAAAHAAAPADPAPFSAAAQIHLWEGQLDRAGQDAWSAVARGARDGATWQLLGDIARARGDVLGARRWWRAALLGDPLSLAGRDAGASLVQADLWVADLPAAQADLAQLRQPTTTTRLMQAIVALHLGAAATARRIMAAFPAPPLWEALAQDWHGTVRDQASLGIADVLGGYPALGAATLQNVLPGMPDAGPAHAYLALAACELGEFAVAAEAIGVAQTLAPQAEATVGATALLALQAGQPQQALALVTTWQAAYQPSVALAGIAVNAAQRAGNLRAEEHARWTLAVLATAEEALPAWAELGAFYLRSGLGRDDGQAATVFQRLARWPAAALALDVLGQWDVAQGHADQAILDWRGAIALAPRASLPHLHLGQFLLKMGNIWQARTELERAAELDNHGELRASLHTTLAQLGVDDAAPRF